jgi:putative transposase
MQLVERQVVLDNRYEDICFKSGCLYNWITYHYRQAIIGKQKLFSEYELMGLCAEFNQPDYRALPPQTSQQIIKLVFKNFKSFFEAKKAYQLDKSGFSGKPKIPGYKTGKKQNIVIFTNQNAKLKNGFIHFPKSAKLKPIKTKVTDFQQVRIIPMATCYVVEIVYNKEEIDLGLDKKRFISIDLGLNNYCTAINNVGLNPFIINGKIIKSFNHWFNKKKAKLMSFVKDKGTSKKLKALNNYRNFWIEDKNHKISREIINYCIKNNIGKIIIGKNINWKQNISLGKRINQQFTQIPHAKLIDKILYKAQLVGIEVILTEESYTSKCDHLAEETMGFHENYLGKRIKRGLFQSNKSKLINADVNGAIGIALKVIPDSFLEIANSGHVFCPNKINII